MIHEHCNRTRRDSRNKVNEMANEYLFLVDSYDNTVLVCKRSWFSDMPITATYNQHGIQMSDEIDRYCDHNDAIKAKCEATDKRAHCEECEAAVETVRAYNFWDGSNYKSIILRYEYDTRYSEITDEEEIAKYTKLVEEAEAEGFEPAGTGYRAVEIDGYRIRESQWQGSFELYEITEVE